MPAAAPANQAPIRFGDLITRRWLRVAACHLIISLGALILWGALVWLRKGILALLLAALSLTPWLALALFLLSQLLFLAGKWVVAEPWHTPGARAGATASWLLQIFWLTTFGGKLGPAEQAKAEATRVRIQVTLERAFFCLVSAAAGALSFSSAVSLQPSSSQSSHARWLAFGAFLGVANAIRQLYRREWVLSFPIIQRRFFFRVKLGFPRAAAVALQLSVAAPALVDAALRLTGGSQGWVARAGWRPWRERYLREFWAASLVTFCWEVGSYLVEVIHTERHQFAPPWGSPEADSAPSGILLEALEDRRAGTTPVLVRHLAFMDLCHLAEQNVDTWRRAALLEETGVSYKRAVHACLANVDGLTSRIKDALDAPRGMDVTSQQMLGPETKQGGWDPSKVEEVFRDYQLCAWSVRAAAALTAVTHAEDRYGVAQLSGCNARVVSALLSCLLAGQTYLERLEAGRKASRGSAGPAQAFPPGGSLFGLVLVSPTAFGWRRLGGSWAATHEQAQSMVDIVQVALYRIVAVFGKEMVGVAPGGKGTALAEHDWLARGEPMFGSREKHKDKLRSLLAYEE